MTWAELPVWLAVTIDVLAVHRLTRLATADIITQRLRDRIIRWSYSREGHEDEMLQEQVQQMVEADMEEDPANTPRLAVLVVCRWCASVWVAAPVTAAHMAAVDAYHGWSWPVLLLLGTMALSSVSTLLARAED